MKKPDVFLPPWENKSRDVLNCNLARSRMFNWIIKMLINAGSFQMVLDFARYFKDSPWSVPYLEMHVDLLQTEFVRLNHPLPGLLLQFFYAFNFSPKLLSEDLFFSCHFLYKSSPLSFKFVFLFPLQHLKEFKGILNIVQYR